MRRFVALAMCVALVGAACSDDSDEPRSEGSPEVEETEAGNGALITELPEDCPGGLGEAPVAGAITFTVEDRLYSVSPNGGEVTCLVPESDSAHDVAWGGEADRVLLGGGLVYRNDFETALESDASEATWSRPTGKALVYIGPDGTLNKQDLETVEARDISFLARHDDVAYHPAGTHIAVSGTDADGIYGLWLADNEGGDPQMLARGEGAQRIDQLVFSHDGQSLYFNADHGDAFHLHELVLRSQESAEGRVTNEAALNTLAKGVDGFNFITVSEFASELPVGYGEFAPRAPVAYSDGCALGIQGESAQPVPPELEDLSTRPVGWLPDGTLLAIGYDGDCLSPTGDLYSIPAAGAAVLVVENVMSASGRAPLPPPPKPPEPVQGVVA